VPERTGAVLVTAFGLVGVPEAHLDLGLVTLAPVTRGRNVSRFSLKVSFGRPGRRGSPTASRRLPAVGIPGGRRKKNFPSTTPVS
jgi:hypothetical protein